jgi:hypothetical protein
MSDLSASSDFWRSLQAGIRRERRLVPQPQSSEPQNAEYQAALRADFYSFLLRCFAELNPALALSVELAHLGLSSKASGCASGQN